MEYDKLPFKVRRSYFLFDSKSLRGGHAHKKEKEIFVCVKGTIEATLHDGKKSYKIMMSSPGKAIYVPQMVWHSFDNFSKNAILLALSSIPYKGRSGYIMDLKEFKKLCKKY